MCDIKLKTYNSSKFNITNLLNLQQLFFIYCYSKKSFRTSCRAKSNEQRAKGNEQQAKSNEQRTTSEKFYLIWIFFNAVEK